MGADLSPSKCVAAGTTCPQKMDVPAVPPPEPLPRDLKPRCATHSTEARPHILNSRRNCSDTPLGPRYVHTGAPAANPARVRCSSCARPANTTTATGIILRRSDSSLHGRHLQSRAHFRHILKRCAESLRTFPAMESDSPARCELRAKLPPCFCT